jgi:hypothetical protein
MDPSTASEALPLTSSIDSSAVSPPRYVSEECRQHGRFPTSHASVVTRTSLGSPGSICDNTRDSALAEQGQAWLGERNRRASPEYLGPGGVAVRGSGARRRSGSARRVPGYGRGMSKTLNAVEPS